MSAFRNDFASVRFARTQPREWRSIPFDGSSKWPKLRHIVGWIVLYALLFGLSLWSIAQSAK